MPDHSSIPVTVIGGYLGAGKTTLVNQILRDAHGRRIAVLVNDFGSINIDEQLIAAHGGETMTFTNGCICCTLASGLVNVLSSLKTLDPLPDHVVIEASGVALPHKIAQYGQMPGFRLNSVIVLADVETIRTRSRDKYVGATVLFQIRGADLLILTKTDLVSPDQRAEVGAWLHGIVPDARIISVGEGEFPIGPLLDFGDRTPHREPANAAIDPEHFVDYDRQIVSFPRPIEREWFAQFVEALPGDVIRAKGIAWLEDDPDRQTIFQLVGKRWSLRAGDAWGAREPSTSIVVIGLPGSFDGSSQEESLVQTTV